MTRLGFNNGEKVNPINRATRNNNPFNIVYGPAIGASNIEWEGKVPHNPEVENTFEVFKNNIFGFRAGMLNSLTHYDKYNDKTVEKLIKRHPHIFDKNYDGEDLSNAKNWELIKKSEKNRKSILDGMPKSLSALIVAQRYQDKTGAVGFEWENFSQAMDKVDEELGELKQAINNNDLNNIEEEIGDLLITIVNLARFFDISADLALRKTNQKFYRRFNFIEKIVQKNNQKIEDISLRELLNYWEKAKNEEK